MRKEKSLGKKDKERRGGWEDTWGHPGEAGSTGKRLRRSLDKRSIREGRLVERSLRLFLLLPSGEHYPKVWCFQPLSGFFPSRFL